MRIPNHIGIIPDGNRRWAITQGLKKNEGYNYGINPGLHVFKLCKDLGIKEITFYGFTTDNTKRPSIQKKAFIDACIRSVELISKEDSEILVLGNISSKSFPKELIKYTKRNIFGKGGIKVNFLINYAWEWDLNKLKVADCNLKNILNNIESNDISRIDLIIRWGGRRRLSGFLPVQCVYSDFYIIDDFWPDFKKEHFNKAIEWYNEQDITLGG
ncbi:undecaprenyl diphosphate synthase family protein [Clostridium tarantellae]|uniref:Dihydroorotate dehydrogenase n=1 Tax=Clostridium tarantellae TaxID=39493 RepID=A0A6I1MRF5_9CLOT|nr:undecaprenyl diphosphate synthase family protein [Clostridium tarantellae]MPQ44767.1 dihydroorotate dehydrogenase [Clostridium tarantellae]